MDFVSNVTNDFNQNDIVNKGFLFVHQLFTQSNSGWYLSENQFGHICYTRKGYETDIFEIKLDRNKISQSRIVLFNIKHHLLIIQVLLIIWNKGFMILMISNQ